VVVKSEESSVDSDHVSDLLNNGEIFESLGIQDQGGEIRSISSSLLVFDVETGIDDLQGADVLVLIIVDSVGEGSVDDGGIEMLSLGGGERSLVQFDVFVLKTMSRGKDLLSGAFLSWVSVPWGPSSWRLSERQISFRRRTSSLIY
jgi:hypothetical protein